jgi:hypothetical protein
MLDTIKEWWGALVTAATVVAGLAVGEYRLRQTEARVGVLEKSSKRRLYDEDGRQIYMPRTECAERAAACRDAYCAKIDGLKEAMKASDERRESFEKETRQILLEMSEKIARANR